jgi:hypothetical protein
MDEAAAMIRQAEQEAAEKAQPRRRPVARKIKTGGGVPAQPPPEPIVVPDVATEPHPHPSPPPPAP